MILRIRFTKHGPVRYIGHLDVMRFFQKAVRRAELDIRYTSGFSPHQVMSFAQPLSVGHESNGEYMDIEVLSFTSCEDVKKRLNMASIPGIQVVSVRVLPEKAGNAMASVAAAAYTVRFREGRIPKCLQVPRADQEKILADFLTQEHILIGKKYQLSMLTLQDDLSALIAVIVIVMDYRFFKNGNKIDLSRFNQGKRCRLWFCYNNFHSTSYPPFGMDDSLGTIKIL